MPIFRKSLTLFFLTAILATPAAVFSNFLVVTPQQISITPEGLFVIIDETPIAVASLNVSNDGYIVAIPNIQAAICPICYNDTYTRGRRCSTCGFPIWSQKPG